MLNWQEYIYSNPNSEPQGGPENKIIPFIDYHTPAPKRCLNMLLDKYYGRPYQSEVIMISPEQTPIPVLKCRLSKAEILLITDGGLVPINNPDHIPSTNAAKFGIYDIAGKETLESGDYEVSHQGYDNTYVEEEPVRLVPVDIMRELEREKVIGKLHDAFISTTGVMTSVEGCRSLGERIAEYVAQHKIDAAIITSACGTSTRCGAHIAMAIEKIGVPVVQVTNLTKIARDTGCLRVLSGNNVCYPLGAPWLPKSKEYMCRKELLMKAVSLINEIPVTQINAYQKQ